MGSSFELWHPSEGQESPYGPADIAAATEIMQMLYPLYLRALYLLNPSNQDEVYELSHVNELGIPFISFTGTQRSLAEMRNAVEAVFTEHFRDNFFELLIFHPEWGFWAEVSGRMYFMDGSNPIPSNWWNWRNPNYPIRISELVPDQSFVAQVAGLTIHVVYEGGWRINWVH